MEVVNVYYYVSSEGLEFLSPCLVRKEFHFKAASGTLRKKLMFIQTKKINQEERMINVALL